MFDFTTVFPMPRKKKSRNIELKCVICGETFKSVEDFEKHLRTESYKDRPHERLFSVYNLLKVHFVRIAQRLFDDFLARILQIESEIKHMRKPNPQKLDAYRKKILSAIPSLTLATLLDESVYSTVNVIIRKTFANPIKTKTTFLRYITKIRNLFEHGTNEYYQAILQTAEAYLKKKPED